MLFFIYSDHGRPEGAIVEENLRKYAAREGIADRLVLGGHMPHDEHLSYKSVRLAGRMGVYALPVIAVGRPEARRSVFWTPACKCRMMDSQKDQHNIIHP